MSFRQNQPRTNKPGAWTEWIDGHRAELKSIGLPPEVYLSESHWNDFLQNGCLEWHPQDSTGFEFGSLVPGASGALRRFLEGQYGAAENSPPLLGWLRVRHEQGRIS
jgi:hypothetical protein